MGDDLARWTGLEPATPGVTGRYSNQLSYHRASRCPEGAFRTCAVLRKGVGGVNGEAVDFTPHVMSRVPG